MADRDRDDRRRRVVDAGRRVTEHSSGDRQAITIPRGMGMFRPKEKGAYRLEVIPFEVGKRANDYKLRKYAEPGDLYFERTYFVHSGIGVNNDTYTCPAKTFGNPCPVCEELARLRKGKQDKETEETIKSLVPRERQLFLIVDCDEEEKGVQLWEVSYRNFGRQLEDKINNADDEDRARYRRFADPEEGSTLKLAATEERIGRVAYLEFSVDEIRDRKRPLDPDWLDHGVCLDDVVREPSYDELKKAFHAAGDDDEPPRDTRRGGDEPRRGRDEEEPAPRRRAAEPEEPRGGRRAAEPEPAPRRTESAATVKVGDEVEWEYRGNTLRGTVVKVDDEKEVATIEVEGRERPAIEDLRELRVAAPKSESEPAPRRRAAEPEPEPEPAPRRRAAEPEPEPEPAPRRRAAEPDDDPPPRGGRRAAEPEPEPAPRAKSRASDWDDEPAPRGGRRAEPDDDPPARKRR